MDAWSDLVVLLKGPFRAQPSSLYLPLEWLDLDTREILVPGEPPFALDDSVLISRPEPRGFRVVSPAFQRFGTEAQAVWLAAREGSALAAEATDASAASGDEFYFLYDGIAPLEVQ